MKKDKFFKSIRKENTFLKPAFNVLEEYDVWLKVDQQSFSITPSYNKKEAEWMRDQLTFALVKLINQYKK